MFVADRKSLCCEHHKSYTMYHTEGWVHGLEGPVFCCGHLYYGLKTNAVCQFIIIGLDDFDVALLFLLHVYFYSFY